jgi:hypothetical protein
MPALEASFVMADSQPTLGRLRKLACPSIHAFDFARL